MSYEWGCRLRLVEAEGARVGLAVRKASQCVGIHLNHVPGVHDSFFIFSEWKMTLAIFGERQSGQDVRSANGRHMPVSSFAGAEAAATDFAIMSHLFNAQCDVSCQPTLADTT